MTNASPAATAAEQRRGMARGFLALDDPARMTSALDDAGTVISTIRRIGDAVSHARVPWTELTTAELVRAIRGGH